MREILCGRWRIGRRRRRRRRAASSTQFEICGRKNLRMIIWIRGQDDGCRGGGQHVSAAASAHPTAVTPFARSSSLSVTVGRRMVRE